MNITEKKKFLSKNDLDSILFKLKRYYNDLNKSKIEVESNIHNLREFIYEADKNISSFNQYKEIHVENQKICINDINNLKETKIEVEDKILSLNEKRNELKIKLNDEREYTNTLNHVIENEKSCIEKLNGRLVESQEKIMAIKQMKRNFAENEYIYNIKKQNFEIVKKQLGSEMKNIDNIIKTQEAHMFEINNDEKNKENNINQLKKQLNEKNKELKESVEETKNKILNEIKNYEEMKKNKISEELRYITIILGFDILKRYFIDVNKENNEIENETLLKSEDYKNFYNLTYTVYDNDNIIFQSDIDKSILTSSANNNFTNNKSKIHLNDLIEKYRDLDIDLESLHNLYTKIINKTSLYLQNMNFFNSKIITLQGKKEMFILRVRNIIKTNFNDFNDLTKNNPNRFENFFKNYSHVMKDIGVSNDLKLIDSIPNNPIFTGFYTKCHNLHSELKSYYEFVLINFKSMVKACDDNNLKDDIKNTIKKIKYMMNEYSKYMKIEKSVYLDSLFDKLYIIPEEKRKLYYHIQEYVQEHKQEFLGLPIEFEKIIFYWFDYIDNVVEILNLISNTLMLCKNIKSKIKKHSSLQKFDDYNNITTVNIVTKEKQENISTIEDDSFSENMNSTRAGTAPLKSKKRMSVSSGFKNNDRIAKKLYEPFVSKRSFYTSLNTNISEVKKYTRDDAITNHKLKKHYYKINKITNDILIYNNPNINVNNLSKETYNGIIKYIITQQLESRKNAPKLMK